MLLFPPSEAANSPRRLCLAKSPDLSNAWREMSSSSNDSSSSSEECSSCDEGSQPPPGASKMRLLCGLGFVCGAATLGFHAIQAGWPTGAQWQGAAAWARGEGAPLLARSTQDSRPLKARSPRTRSPKVAAPHRGDKPGLPVSTDVVNREEKTENSSEACDEQLPEGVCNATEAFFDQWIPADPWSCQRAMDQYVVPNVGLELAMTRTQYVEIYHENVGMRFSQFQASGIFRFSWASNWSVDLEEENSSRIVVDRPILFTMRLGFLGLFQIKQVLRDMPEGFRGTDKKEVQDCVDCPGIMRISLQEVSSGSWMITKLAMIECQ